MEIYTIGFTQKSARQFFELLKAHGIRRVVDIRRRNTGQLAGFTKKDDLEYFLHEIVGADYVHEPLLAPSDELLSDYRAGKTSWEQYEPIFHGQLVERDVVNVVPRSLFDRPAALLCSEPTADQCHRRLVAEHLRQAWGDVRVVHL